MNRRTFVKNTYYLQGDWELLSGERLVTLLKIAQLQLNDTWETKSVMKYESSCFRKYIDLFSNLLRSSKNNLIYFRKQLVTRENESFLLAEPVPVHLRVGAMGGVSS